MNNLLALYLKEKTAREQKDLEYQKLVQIHNETKQKLTDQNIQFSHKLLEFDYVYKVTSLIKNYKNINESFINFLQITSNLVWADIAYCFNYNSNDIEKIGQVQILENDESEILPIKKEELINLLPLKKDYILIDRSDNTKIYLFKLDLNAFNQFYFVFAFSKSYELPEKHIHLIMNGLNVIKNLVSKKNIKQKLLDNYKQMKQMKNQLIHSEKMASIGILSAGIAHEVNNPLAFLLTNLEVLKQYEKRINLELKNTNDNNLNFILNDLPNLIDESLIGLNRIKDIVNGLKTFSRIDDEKFKKIDLNNIIIMASKIIKNELKIKNIKLIYNESPNNYFSGVEGQILQVVTNLLINSIHAVLDNGIITISIHQVDNHIILKIKDNGIGIKKENFNSIFTPFFTTKQQGQGTGLGLSISYSIIQNHNGKISFTSEENIGTEFTIIFPSLNQGAIDE